MRGAAPKHRKALCHPNRKHYAKDLCAECYRNHNNAKGAADKQPGLTRLHTPGWGSLRGPAT